jgi:hypothetical protein
LRVANLPFCTLASLSASRAAAAADEALCIEERQATSAAALISRLFAAAGRRADDPAHDPVRLPLVRMQRDLFNCRPLRAADVEAAGPGLSAEDVASVASFADGDRRRTDSLSLFRAAFSEELRAYRSALARLAHQPLLEHGIYLAGRDLPAQMRRLSRRDPRDWTKGDRHAAATLAAYVTRACAKTSPHGVFCSVAVATLGEHASVQGDPAVFRLDVAVGVAEARKITSCLAIDRGLDGAIVPRPNPTLRPQPEGVTFWRPATLRRTTNDEVFSRAKDHPILRLFLEEAARGCHSITALVEAVSNRCEIGRAELDPFFRALVERGILIAEIETPYTCRRPLRQLARVARAAAHEGPWVPVLEAVEADVDSLPSLDFASQRDTLERIGASLDGLPHTRTLERDELFRVDSASSLRVELPASVLADIERGMHVYARLLSAMFPASAAAATLAERFLQDHAPDVDVPFLDRYRGFSGDEDLSARPTEFAAPAGGPAAAGSPAANQKRVFDFLAERASLGQEEVELDEAAVDALVGVAPSPAWSCGVLFQVAARSLRDIDEGRYRVVLNSLFNGGGLALARFAHLLGGGAPPEKNPIVGELRRGWSLHERPGAVLAEITYNHDGRTANAGLRPALVPYEIELPGDKASPGAHVLPLSDLVMRYDRVRRRLVLRSVSRGVEVLPVLSSGVNPVGIVSELVEIGRQGLLTMGYLPGFEVPGVVFWPRFSCGRMVLFRRRWVFRRPEDLPRTHGRNTPLPDADFFYEVARWRRRFRLPQHVFVHTRAKPKPFYCDLASPLAALLHRAMSGAGGAQAQAQAQDGGATVLFVTEMLPGPDEMWIQGPEGAFASEFLVQLESGPADHTSSSRGSS